MKRENIWNLPNLLTALRFVLIGVFVQLFLSGQDFKALGIFLLAGVTDFLDGYIARRQNLITNFGKLADPLADKLMLITALICLQARGIVAWWVVVAVCAKELLMMLGSFLMYKKGVVVYAKMIGKVSTVFFIAAVTAAFFHGRIAPWDSYLLYAAVALSIAAMVFYAANVLHLRAEKK